MVVARLVGRERVERLELHRVLRGRVAERGGVALWLLGGSVEGRLDTGEEAVSAVPRAEQCKGGESAPSLLGSLPRCLARNSPDDSIGSDGGAVEGINEGSAVEGRLPVDGSDEGSLGALVWVDETEELELQACASVAGHEH